MTFQISFFLLFILLVSIIAQTAKPEAAEWSPSQPLPCDPKGEASGNYPQAAVDRQGRLHVLWQSGTAIFYCRAEGDVWTEKNDIIATAENEPFIIGPVAIDDRDNLNLLWVDQGRTRSLFLSQAHVSLASRPQSWKTQVLYSPSISIDGAHLAPEAGGKLHVVYVWDHRVVHYMVSSDSGKTWSTPNIIWEVGNPDEEAATASRIAVDAQGYLHVVWTLNVRERSWQGEAVFYARSTDGGQTWNTTEVQRSAQGESTAAWINVTVRNGSEIHLAWNRGAGSRLGRYHSWSPDNGMTWNGPTPFLPEFVSGQTGWPLMVVDSAGTLHLVTIAQGGTIQGESIDNSGSGAPKYAYWDGQVWSSMYEFPEGSSDLHIALAVGLGNQLHLIHPSVRGGGQWLYNKLVTNAPPVAAQPIQVPVATVTPQTSTPTPQPIKAIVPIPSNQPGSFRSEKSVKANPVLPVVVSTIAVMVLLILSLGWRLMRLGGLR